MSGPVGGMPLEGVRVLAFEQYGAGPWATLQLADLGADVIKVEDPVHGGDVGRTVPPYRSGDTSLFFEALNRGKRSVSLDLRAPAGREALHALVPQVDAVFSNLRGDQPARLGITYEQLGAVNERIVCCSLSGFGMTGPRASQPAYDYVIQAMAGWMSITGEPDGPPAKSGLSLVDFAGGYAAAIALLGGLWQTQRTGRGCDCDISLLETAISLLNYVGTWAATAGFSPERLSHSAHPSIVPFQALPTADGWVVVACAKQKFWERLCAVLERRDLLEDRRFADFAGRAEHRSELVRHLETAFRERTSREWIEALEGAGVPCGPVNTVDEALAEPQLAARDGLVTMAHPEFGTVRHLASPLRVGAGARSPAPAPPPGGDTQLVWQELARLDPERFAELANAGAFGPPDTKEGVA